MAYNYHLKTPYLTALNYKWESIDYHLETLQRIPSCDRELIAIRAHFDGLMYQLHSTYDIVGQLVNNALSLNLDTERLYLSNVIAELKKSNSQSHEVKKAVSELYEKGEYIRDYVNYSKHRNIITLDSNWSFVSPNMPIQFVLVASFEKDRRHHKGGNPLELARREVEMTGRIIEKIFIILDTLRTS